jgi:hypothetical protein
MPTDVQDPFMSDLEAARDAAAAEAEASDQAAADAVNSAPDSDGQTIEDMAENGVDEGGDEIRIDGNTGQLSLAVGGAKPKLSEFSMRSARVQVDGQYSKGDTVTLTVVARVDEIDFLDMHDEFGNVRTTKRIHKAKPISIERAVVEED